MSAGRIIPFPSREVRQSLETLQAPDITFEEQAGAAARLVRGMTDGEAIPRAAYACVLYWVYRHRRHPSALELARELARVDAPEIRLLGVGLVKYAREPEEAAVGRALFG
jgi:hypothetical protein